jgi:hypothetical protein
MGLEPRFIREMINAPGEATVRHRNGNIYYIDALVSIKINGEWVDGVTYHSINPWGQYCRTISDFHNFEYIHNHTVRGPRG